MINRGRVAKQIKNITDEEIKEKPLKEVEKSQVNYLDFSKYFVTVRGKRSKEGEVEKEPKLFEQYIDDKLDTTNMPEEYQKAIQLLDRNYVGYLLASPKRVLIKKDKGILEQMAKDMGPTPTKLPEVFDLPAGASIGKICKNCRYSMILSGPATGFCLLASLVKTKEFDLKYNHEFYRKNTAYVEENFVKTLPFLTCDYHRPKTKLIVQHLKRLKFRVPLGLIKAKIKRLERRPKVDPKRANANEEIPTEVIQIDVE